MDAVAPLAFLAARTTRIALGTGIMQLSARAPAMTAMTALTLASISGDRFRAGPRRQRPAGGGGAARRPVRQADRRACARRSRSCARHSAASRSSTRAPSSRCRSRAGRARRCASPTRRTRASRSTWPSLSPAGLALCGELADGWLGTSFTPEHADAHLRHLAEGAAAVGPLARGARPVRRRGRRLRGGSGAADPAAQGASGLHAGRDGIRHDQLLQRRLPARWLRGRRPRGPAAVAGGPARRGRARACPTRWCSRPACSAPRPTCARAFAATAMPASPRCAWIRSATTPARGSTRWGGWSSWCARKLRSDCSSVSPAPPRVPDRRADSGRFALESGAGSAETPGRIGVRDGHTSPDRRFGLAARSRARCARARQRVLARARGARRHRGALAVDARVGRRGALRPRDAEARWRQAAAHEGSQPRRLAHPVRVPDRLGRRRAPRAPAGGRRGRRDRQAVPSRRAGCAPPASPEGEAAPGRADAQERRAGAALERGRADGPARAPLPRRRAERRVPARAPLPDAARAGDGGHRPLQARQRRPRASVRRLPCCASSAR